MNPYPQYPSNLIDRFIGERLTYTLTWALLGVPSGTVGFGSVFSTAFTSGRLLVAVTVAVDDARSFPFTITARTSDGHRYSVPFAAPVTTTRSAHSGISGICFAQH
uniref:Uncharacterized protein n=1 Tax=Anopheles culicifacies TaxID=139723 RepID=A0A182LRG7_9DIPT